LSDTSRRHSPRQAADETSEHEGRHRSTRRLFVLPVDWFDVVTLAALAALSMWMVALLVRRGHQLGLIWTGTDGPYITDQMQYLGWIRDSAHHVLIGNPYQLAASPHDFLHPGLAISGILNRLGMGAWLAYLVWKPVAVLALFAAARAYVYRLLPGTTQRRFALVLALFFVSPVSYHATTFGWHWKGVSLLQPYVFEMWPSLYLWGYPFTAIAVALLPATLLAYERARRQGRVGVLAPTLALFCAWLQPWQGATVVVVLLASEAVLWRGRTPAGLRLLAITESATVAPLLYYAILGRVDPAWKLADVANSIGPWPWKPLLLAIAPLGLLATLAYVQPAQSFGAVAVRVWPIAAVGLYGFIAVSGVGTFPIHALQGLSIPLAVLAIDGVSRVRIGGPPRAKVAIAIAALALLGGPAVVRELSLMRDRIGFNVGPYAEPFLIQPGERDAFDYIERSRLPGGVFAQVYLGEVVPARTGRRTWVGIPSWTPDYHQRIAAANTVFAERTPPAEIRRIVRSSGARFVLSDCRNTRDLTHALRPMLLETHRFGCATVYVVR
jgi:hypothetical protein